MEDRVIALIEYLNNTKDPDEVVDFLDIDTYTLVDALNKYIDDWVVLNDWRPEDEQY
jgi:hypothetical protein